MYSEFTALLANIGSKIGKRCKAFFHLDDWSFVSRAKKLSKQTDRLQVQLLEERSRNRELSAQLTEAADYKVIFLFLSSYRAKRHTHTHTHARTHRVVRVDVWKLDSGFGTQSKDRRGSKTAGRERDAENSMQQKINPLERTNENNDWDCRAGKIHQRPFVATAKGRASASQTKSFRDDEKGIPGK